MTDKTGGPATDRELLELAAKAAGIIGEYHDMADGMRIETNPGHEWWNPLTDDGDALRLAVRLTIHLRLCTRTIIAEWSNTDPDILESRGSDACADTRRAIVRAAAAIGSAK